MKSHLWMIGFLIILLMGACNQDDIPKAGENNSNTSTREAIPANNDITNFLQNEATINDFYIAEDEQRMLIGVKLKQFHRFQRNKLEKEWEQTIQDTFTEKDVTVSSDFKILHELKKKQTNSKKQITKLLNLLKEET